MVTIRWGSHYFHPSSFSFYKLENKVIHKSFYMVLFMTNSIGCFFKSNSLDSHNLFSDRASIIVWLILNGTFTISRDLEFPILMFFFPSKQCCFNVYPLDASSFRITQLVVWDLFLVFLAMIDRYLVKYDSIFLLYGYRGCAVDWYP